MEKTRPASAAIAKSPRSTMHGLEVDVEQDTPVQDNSLREKTLVQPRKHIDQDLNPDSTLPKTPLRLFRSSLSLPSSSNGKRLRLLGITSCSLLSRDGQGQSEFPAEMHNKNSSPSSKRIKTLSPNSKRISPHIGNSAGLQEADPAIDTVVSLPHASTLRLRLIVDVKIVGVLRFSMNLKMV
ncbi:hypothetical protein V2J09_018004 [Rumex salicifolius]